LRQGRAGTRKLRQRALIRDPHRLADEKFDLLVIGGGIHGACAARDAALRGLRTALVERGDFGAYTSHNSLKIVHGGLRYLQHLDFARTRESVLERSFWLRRAPHLVRPLGFLMPLHGYGSRGPLALWAGLRMHEAIGWDRNNGIAADRRLPKGRLISSAEVRRLMPDLRDDALTGGAIWYDGQMLDADRLLLVCMEDAIAHGAAACNYVSAKRIEVENGRARGAEVQDELSGERFFIRSDQIINAAGPWAAELVGRALTKSARFELPHTRNMNLVVPNFLGELAIGVRSQRRSDSVLDASNRSFFITPWRDVCVIGTTHVPYEGSADDCRFDEADIGGFLSEVNAAYDRKLTLDDVLYCYGGLTPAERGQHRGEARLARRSNVIDHGVTDGVAGLVSLVGIKYTTARLAAQKAVDAVCAKLGRASRSSEEMLPGGAKYASEAELKANLSRTTGEPESSEGDSFVAAFGADFGSALEVGAWSRADGEDALFRCRVRYAVRKEMAVRLEDVVVRRSGRLARGRLRASDLRWACDFMAKELGWTPARARAEIEATTRTMQRHWAKLRPNDSDSAQPAAEAARTTAG
jgi:glycerol-3-phosphate dehydrogenase